MEEKGYETAIIASIAEKITPDSLTAVRDYQELTNFLYKKHPTAWNPEATGNERCKDRLLF
ncbi:MAG: hypothetical protein IKQ59_15640 [Prevotella sp.]|nr:hypothetical protein [Prevotella sp.]